MAQKTQFKWSKNKLNAENIIRTPTTAELYIWQHGKCFFCDRAIDYSEMTRDHLFPKSNGYKLTGNKVLACGNCNSNKGRRVPSICEVYKAAKMYVLHDYFFVVKTKIINNNIKPIMRQKINLRLHLNRDSINKQWENYPSWPSGSGLENRMSVKTDV